MVETMSSDTQLSSNPAAAKAGRDISTQEEIKQGVRFKFSLLTWHSRRASTPPRGRRGEASKQNPISPIHLKVSLESEVKLYLRRRRRQEACACARKPSNPLRSVNDTVSGRLGSAADGEKINKYKKGLRLGRGGTLCWEDGGDFF